MSSALKAGKKIVDFFGVFVASVSFLTIFVTFMISIISRYIIRVPVTWTYEISVLGYMWCMFFGVGKAMEKDEHVVFALVYDKLNPAAKKHMLILYNVILAVLLAAVFVPCIQSAMKSSMSTGVLKLPYKLVFAPFFFMTADIIIRSIIRVVSLIRMDGSKFEEEEANKK